MTVTPDLPLPTDACIGARSRLRARARHFWRDNHAVSAIEFALLLPFMLILYIGGNEVGESIAIYRKVAQSTYTMGDLVTQVSSVAVTDVSNILDASTSVMLPYPASGAVMSLAAVTYNGGTSYTIAWSLGRTGGANYTPWAPGSALPSTMVIPAGLVTINQQLIVGQVSYQYTSPFTQVMQGIWGTPSITMSDVVYLRPRLSTTIPCTGC